MSQKAVEVNEIWKVYTMKFVNRKDREHLLHNREINREEKGTNVKEARVMNQEKRKLI